MADASRASYLKEGDNDDHMTSETNKQSVTGNTLDLATCMCTHAVGDYDYI